MGLKVEDRREGVAADCLLEDRAFNLVNRILNRLVALPRKVRIILSPAISRLARDSGSFGGMRNCALSRLAFLKTAFFDCHICHAFGAYYPPTTVPGYNFFLGHRRGSMYRSPKLLSQSRSRASKTTGRLPTNLYRTNNPQSPAPRYFENISSTLVFLSNLSNPSINEYGSGFP